MESSNVRPWADLPDYLIEKIFDGRQEIFDYLRLGTVCQEWRSIHDSHRRHHAPSPPNLLTFPWFLPRKPQREPVECFTTFPEHQQRSDRIRLPSPRCCLRRRIETKCRRCWLEALPNGWLVLDDLHYDGAYAYTLVNPMSGVEIRLPKIGEGLSVDYKLVFSPPPNFLVLLTSYTWNTMSIRLFREGDEDWTELEFPDRDMRWTASSLMETSAIVWEGKVYYMYQDRGLMVIDPLPSNPTIELLEMDQSQLPELKHRGMAETLHHYVDLFMVESDGKILLVVLSFDDRIRNGWELVFELGFQVFEADFSTRKWTRTETLGGRAIFIHQKSVWSGLAVDIGAEANCIYFQHPADIQREESQEKLSGVGAVPWSVFNLGTGTLTKSPLSCAPTPYTHIMFMPSMS